MAVLGDAGAVVDRRRKVWDILGNGVLQADSARVDTVTLAGLGHGIVARVEIFAFFEMLGEVVGA